MGQLGQPGGFLGPGPACAHLLAEFLLAEAGLLVAIGSRSYVGLSQSTVIPVYPQSESSSPTGGVDRQDPAVPAAPPNPPHLKPGTEGRGTRGTNTTSSVIGPLTLRGGTSFGAHSWLAPEKKWHPGLPHPNPRCSHDSPAFINTSEVPALSQALCSRLRAWRGVRHGPDTAQLLLLRGEGLGGAGGVSEKPRTQIHHLHRMKPGVGGLGEGAEFLLIGVDGGDIKPREGGCPGGSVA